MKKAVIFDLDGLLIDSEIISYNIYADLLRRYRLPFNLDTYARLYSGKNDLTNMQTLIYTYHLPLTVEEGLAFVDAREKEYFAKGVALKSGAKELLHFLKNHHVKILLASSSTRERALGILNQHGIAGFFDAMVFGPEIERGKPFPDIFIKAQGRSGETAADCLVLEDSEAGIRAACGAGIDVICIPDMKKPDEPFLSAAAAVLPSLLDVPMWLTTSSVAAATPSPKGKAGDAFPSI